MKTVWSSTICAALLLFGSRGWAADFTSNPQCDDGADNDGDGLTDYSPAGGGDPGCDAWNDTSETNVPVSQVIKARLAVLVDTSGSMTWGICGSGTSGNFPGGDNSRECPGTNLSCSTCDSATCSSGTDDTRIYKVKAGMHDAVAAYGELEWSLYRFHQTLQGSFNCPTDTSDQPAMGRWRGATSSNNSCGSFASADRLVRFSPENIPLILQWMDNTSDWNPAKGGKDYELRPSGFTPIKGSLDSIRGDLDAIRSDDSASSCRPYRVVLIGDGADTCHGDQASEDAAKALLDDDIPVYFIGFAANDDLKTEMDALADAGGTGSAYFADEPDDLSNALAQIAAELILVEKCNGLDDDCDGVTDNGFDLGSCDNGQLGTCFRQGQKVCNGPSQTICNAPHVDPGDEASHGCNGLDDDCDGVIDNGLSCNGCGSELCNGQDDDCDGMTDEGTLPGEGEECQFSLGECHAGHYECESGRLVCKGFIGPSTEVCDGLDNNCDGVTDQIARACYDLGGSGCIDKDPSAGGVQWECKGRCRAGTQICTIMTEPDFGTCIGEVGPTAEICNGIDDDCDGMTDEGFENVGKACEVGKGACKASGHFVCQNGGLVCDAPVIPGSPEVCNGIDDDCDGVIDNLPNPPPSPIGESCGTCGGTYQCKGGLVCTGGQANPETCNGKDDDCNGVADDGALPGVGEPCVPSTNGTPNFMLRGECRPGANACLSGGLQCLGALGPQPEICDSKDNDCDGITDDMAACPSASDVCYLGACVSACNQGEFPCPFGQFCKDLPEGRFCVKNPCVTKVCPTGQVCDPETAECKDPCANVTCPSGTTCNGGRCYDCFTLGCPSGQVCLAADGGFGKCMNDVCGTVTCARGQVCDLLDGSCDATACPQGCDQGQACDKGVCVAHCAADLCFGNACSEGYTCNPATGHCIADACERANCGTLGCGISCQGEAVCGLSKGIDVFATGSGGAQLHCEIHDVAGGRGPWIAGLVYLGMLIGLRRRRRP